MLFYEAKLSFSDRSNAIQKYHQAIELLRNFPGLLHITDTATGGEAAVEYRRVGLFSAPKGPTGSPRTWGPPRGCVGLSCPARPRGEPNPTVGRRSLGPSGGARAETRAPQPWVSEERPSSRAGSNTPGGVYPPRPPAGGAQARSAVHSPDSTVFWERGVHDTSALGRAGSLVAVACGHHAKRPAGPRYVRQANPKTV